MTLAGRARLLDPAGGRSPQSRFRPGHAADWGGGRGREGRAQISSAISFWKASELNDDSPRPTGPRVVATVSTGWRENLTLQVRTARNRSISGNDSSDLTSVRRVHAGSASCGCTMPLMFWHEGKNVAPSAGMSVQQRQRVSPVQRSHTTYWRRRILARLSRVSGPEQPPLRCKTFARGGASLLGMRERV